MKKYILLVFCFTCLAITSKAQFGIDEANFQLKYNPDSCWYDFYLVINSGSAKTEEERYQLNAQITIVVPTGTAVSIPKGYMPLLKNDVAGTGFYSPNYWSLVSNIVNPIAAPGKDFWGIYPNLAIGNALYNELVKGDEVKLFSLNMSPIVNCAKDVRLYINGVDPSSADPGMAGSDFTNAFYMQSTKNNVYEKNLFQVYPNDKIINDHTKIVNANEISIDVTTSPTVCQLPLSYQWLGPSSFSSIAEDVYLSPITIENKGLYKLIVCDALGCKDSIELNLMTDTKEDIENTVVKTYPNPIIDLLNIESDESHMGITIEDIKGRTILHTTDRIIHVNHLGAGLYNLRIKIGDKEVVKRLIKI